MNVLALCAGAGGLELGIEAACPDARTVCWVEWELSAAAVLAAHMEAGDFPPAPIWSDVRTFDGRPWRGVVDCITGGYPCQPFSVAGKRRGKDDPRHLWPHIARIVGEVEPAWCFFENVGGHLRLGYFDIVRPDLERLGYRVTEGLFTAEEVGAPHQRERLFILADASGGGRDGWARNEGRRSQRRDDASGAGAELADPGHAEPPGRERAPGGTEGQPRPEPSPRGGRLGDADGEHDDGCGDVGTGRWAEPADAERSVGDANGPRIVADTERERGRSGDGGREDAADVDAAGQTLFPPGPGERGRWAAILAGHPELAPAVGRKLNPRFVEWLMNWPINWTSVVQLTHEDVLALWRGDDPETSGAGQRAREPISVQSPKILRPEVHGGGDGEAGQVARAVVSQSKESPAIDDRPVRAMPEDGEPGGSPRGPELAQQRPFEHSDALRVLSHIVAPLARGHHAEAREAAMQALRETELPGWLLQHLPDEDKAAWDALVWPERVGLLLEIAGSEPALARISPEVARRDLSRAQRLRLTGNGVVPLQAAYALAVLAGRAGLTL